LISTVLEFEPSTFQNTAKFNSLHVAQNKVEELKTSGEIRRAFSAIREPLGEFAYLGILAKDGVKSPEKFTSTEEARKCYREMLAAAKKGVA
jgi:hypothetical protein